MIDRLSTELKQNSPYFVNRLIIKEVRIGIKCNPVVELKIILILCRRDLFCVNSEISFRYFTTFYFRRFGSLLLIGLLNTRSETE